MNLLKIIRRNEWCERYERIKPGAFVSSKFIKLRRIDERKHGYSYYYYSFTLVLIRVFHFLAH